MGLFDDAWVEIYRSDNGTMLRVEVCDAAGQRIKLPLTCYKVHQDASDIGIAELHIHHGRVEYKDA